MSNSNNKQVIFSEEAREKILEGATILARAVGSTIGPGGHGVIIEHAALDEAKRQGIGAFSSSPSFAAPLITKDGVTVARSIRLKDKLASIGAELLKEVANKTNDQAGDGTSTATVLAHALLQEGTKIVTSGYSSVFVKRGMESALEIVLDYLNDNKILMTSEQELISVATIAANGDREIGRLIASAISQVGIDGLITIEPAKSIKTNLRLAEGIRLEAGFVSPFFVTNNDKQLCELENPYVLITTGKISSLSEILPVLEQIDQTKKSLLIVAEDVEGEALHTLVVNKVKGVIKVCAVKSPSYGENRADLLADLGIVVGTQTVLGATSELSIKKIKLEHLGQCKKAIIGRNFCTIIVDEKNDKVRTDIKNRADSIRNSLTSETSVLDPLRQDKYRQRLAKLSGGIAIIQVGGSTEVEIFEKKDRVEDAVNATQAAAQEGIVPGGGTALFYAAQHLKSMIKTGIIKTKTGSVRLPVTLSSSPIDDFFEEQLSQEEVAGLQLVANACEAPFRIIIENSGESAEVVANKLIQHQSGFKGFVLDTELIDSENINEIIKEIQQKSKDQKDEKVIEAKKCFGYNVATKKYGNLIEAGIIDPCKVTKHALENAVSVVSLMLACDAVVLAYDESDNNSKQ